MKKALHFLAFALFLETNAFASPLDDQIKNFTDAVKATETAKNPNNPRMEAFMLPGLQNGNDMPGGDINLESTVRQLMASENSPEVQKTGQALLDAIEARRKERLDTATAKINAVLDRAPAILAKAQKPPELDGLLTDLQAAQPAGNAMGYGGDPDLQAQTNRLNTAYQFVTQWQDYLSAQENNLQDALNALRNLSNSRTDPVLVPRSDILARIADLEARTKTTAPVYGVQPTPPDLTPILDGIKTLDDLAPAVQKLPANNVSQGNNYISLQLSQFASLYADAKNGFPISLDLNPPNYYSNAPQPDLDRIKSMLLLYLLPLYFGPSAPAVDSGETVQAYLGRVMAAAENAQNWVLLQHVVEAKLKIARVQNTPVGAQSFLAGLNQEIAGQYALAIPSYETALRQPDDFTPASVIGDRLASIKKDHPADFDSGMKNVLNPPAPTYMNPYARFGLPGYSYPVPATTPNTLSTPALNFSPPPISTPAATPHTNVPPTPSGK